MKQSSKWIFVITVVFSIFNFLPAKSNPVSNSDKPNIVIILADDFGYGSSNCYGAPKSLIRTPHMDRLAEQGIRFTDANTPGSVCTPTRYALLTGQYAWRGRLKYGVLSPPEGGLLIDDDLFTLPEYLKKHGYQTAQIGKWHLGYTNQYNVEDLSAQPLTPGPRSMGFDYHFGVPNNIDWLPKVYIENEEIMGLRSKGKSPYGRSYYKAQAYHGYDAPQRVTTQVTQDLNDKACEWIYKCARENPEKPFFLYFAPVAIHTPVAPADKMRGSSGCGSYGDYIQDLDHSVGEIIEALAYSGELDNTLLIFTSDNGGNIGDREEQEAREKGLKNNGNFRGDKHTIWEGGFRVPFIARWPGHIEQGAVTDRMINIVDIYATIQEMLDGEIMLPNRAAADSYTFYDELIGKRNPNSVRPHMIVNNVQGIMAIRKGQWKYIEGEPATSLTEGQKKFLANQLEPQLYNLKEDIQESKDLINEKPEIAQELKDVLEQIRKLGSERKNL